MKLAIFALYPYEPVNGKPPLFGGVPVWREVKKIEMDTITEEYAITIYKAMAQQIPYNPRWFKTHIWQVGQKGFRVRYRQDLNKIYFEV